MSEIITIIVETWPWLLAMLVLIGLSAFFSGSEAALFLLRGPERRDMMRRGQAARVAARLMEDPDRVLSAVLFWNLVINLVYFAISSIISIDLSHRGGSAAAAFALGSLLTLVFCSEMLPKSVAVLNPRRCATVVSLPMATMVRLIDPMLPLLRTITLLSRRLVWPGFEKEAYLDNADLERAIRLSTDDAALLASEEMVLHNIVSLGDIRMDEMMRPRLLFRTYRPPVAWADLNGQMPPSGYLLLTDEQGDEVVSFVNLKEPARLLEDQLDAAAEPVVYVPWCADAPEALDLMQSRDCEVAVVVNEMGETIGVATLDDMLDAIYTRTPGRSDRLLKGTGIRKVGDGLWHVTGMTSVRRLAKYFQRESLPSGRNVTIAGVLQDQLQRLPEAGDQCEWAGFSIRVLEVPERGYMTLELTVAPGEEVSS